MGKLTPVCLATLLLTSCSYDYPLKAIFQDGELYFVGAKGDTGFCPNAVSLRSGAGHVVWQIETDEFIHPCKLFPLRLGSQPRGWKTVVAASPLKSGELYILTGSGGDSYHGAFRYQESRLLSVSNSPEMAMDYPPYSGREWRAGDEAESLD